MACYPNAGIYVIINKSTGQRYFGQAKDFDNRVKLDKLYMSHGCHNPWLMTDISA